MLHLHSCYTYSLRSALLEEILVNFQSLEEFLFQRFPRMSQCFDMIQLNKRVHTHIHTHADTHKLTQVHASRCRMCSVALRSFLFLFSLQSCQNSSEDKQRLPAGDWTVHMSLPSCQNIVPSRSLQLTSASPFLFSPCSCHPFLHLSSLVLLVLSETLASIPLALMTDCFLRLLLSKPFLSSLLCFYLSVL